LLSPHFVYDPRRVYSLEEFEAINDCLKKYDIFVAGKPISHFDRTEDGRLIAFPQVPVRMESALHEIGRQLGNWNIQTKQNGNVTSSQGGFTFGGTITAPDVSFVPGEVYQTLPLQQLDTFKGDAFCPTFVMELDDLSDANTKNSLTEI
jgi:Uma2 family endonuclease